METLSDPSAAMFGPPGLGDPVPPARPLAAPGLLVGRPWRPCPPAGVLLAVALSGPHLFPSRPLRQSWGQTPDGGRALPDEAAGAPARSCPGRWPHPAVRTFETSESSESSEIFETFGGREALAARPNPTVRRGGGGSEGASDTLAPVGASTRHLCVTPPTLREQGGRQAPLLHIPSEPVRRWCDDAQAQARRMDGRAPESAPVFKRPARHASPTPHEPAAATGSWDLWAPTPPNLWEAPGPGGAAGGH